MKGHDGQRLLPANVEPIPSREHSASIISDAEYASTVCVISLSHTCCLFSSSIVVNEEHLSSGNFEIEHSFLSFFTQYHILCVVKNAQKAQKTRQGPLYTYKSEKEKERKEHLENRNVLEIPWLWHNHLGDETNASWAILQIELNSADVLSHQRNTFIGCIMAEDENRSKTEKINKNSSD